MGLTSNPVDVKINVTTTGNASAAIPTAQAAATQTAPATAAAASSMGIDAVIAKEKELVAQKQAIEWAFYEQKLSTSDIYEQQITANQAAQEELRKDTKYKFAMDVAAKQKQLDSQANEARTKSIQNTAAMTSQGLAIANQALSDLSTLNNVFEKDRRKAAKNQKMINIAMATMNMALGISNAFATMPWPASIGAAALAGTSGAIQLAAVIAEPIPEAETGGRFEVPALAGGRDNVGMRVNPGEKIQVTPRSEEPKEDSRPIIVQIDSQSIFTIMQKGLNLGKIYVPGANIR
jgi:hypothetical protein